MSEVIYFELGTRDLQVVPRAKLIPLHNYELVKRVWGQKVFNLVDVGCNKNFTATPCSAKFGGSTRYLATLHWDERIPRELRYDEKFWVGPIDEYVLLDNTVLSCLNEPEAAGPSKASQQSGSSTALEPHGSSTSSLRAGPSTASPKPRLSTAPQPGSSKTVQDSSTISKRSGSSSSTTGPGVCWSDDGQHTPITDDEV